MTLEDLAVALCGPVGDSLAIRVDNFANELEFKQPTRVDATPLPEPSEVDLRHAELAEKFASFAAYVKQHEKPVRPPPVLGTRVRPLSLRGTKSLGHTSSHRLPGQGRYSATQGPIR